MSNYEIRVTNEEDDNDFATLPHYIEHGEEEGTTAEDVLGIVNAALNYGKTVQFRDGERYVVIEPTEEGYMYDMYSSKKDYEDGKESEDGGQCTGTLSDAIDMAINQ